MRRLAWSASARRDLLRVAKWFDEMSPGLGDEMLERIEQVPVILLEQPAIGSPTRKPGVRKWTIRKTPFLITYRFNADQVEVRRVYHVRMERPY